MAITSDDFNISISPNPISVTVGMTGNVNLSFSNTSLTERGYNLSVSLTLPDGVSYAGGLIPPTSTINGPGGIIVLTWTNIKDLAPKEIGYNLAVTLKADENFRTSGLPVPFDIPLTSVDLSGTVDTNPRGNDDPNPPPNVQITKTDSSTFIPLRYHLTKAAPGKMPKGAGLFSPITAPRWPYQYTLTVENNSRESSTVTLIDSLPNGVRYLGGLLVTGLDSLALSSPTIILPFGGPGGQDFVTINWGTVVLSSFSVNTIVFNAAIWDNYTASGIENSGARIPHLTPLQNVATLNGLSGPVQGIATTNAMDATIAKRVASSSTDVNVTNNYTLTYRINQYDNVENVIITDTISDGQTYNEGSASLMPVEPNPPRNIDGTTTLSWDFVLLTTDATGNITFSTTTSANYYLGALVVAADEVSNDVIITGINQTTLTPTPDSSRVSLGIGLPSIKKEIIGYFYKDGSPKTINVVAPGDGVEFKITYSSRGLAAQQLGIEIDEYAPPNMGPLTALPVIYGGTFPNPAPPVTVSPNGLRWILGTVLGNRTWTADFIIPVADYFVGVANNLAKFAGINTVGLGYSDRDQVEVKFGQPNITFAKTVAGPDVNAIRAGENYTYSVTISNPQNLEGDVTDAFEMDFTDVIPTDLLYTGFSSVIGTGIHSAPVFTGQNVSMTINKLAPGESLTLNYTVLVTTSVASGQSYINNAVLQRPYSQPDRTYPFPGEPFTASTTLKALGVTMTKLISPPSAKIGDKVTYLLQVTVPLGTTAYNVKVVDTFPIATQTYIGNATVDGLPILPSVSGGIVTFPTIHFVDATSATVNIIYAFDVRVVSGTHISPFIQNQINNATVNWELGPLGPAAVPFNTSATLQVRTPNLVGTKQQRNATTGGTFTSGTVPYSIGNIIEYRITLNNTGAEAAYNSVLTDVLNPLLSFLPGFITIPIGTTASFAANTVTWNIPFLAAGANATILFGVTTLAGIGSDGRITDSASFVYKTNDNGFEVSYGGNTNIVTLIAPPVTILKSASLAQGEIGDDITYTITYTVPSGTIAYSPILTDTLPVGQTYIGPATRQDTGGPVTAPPLSVLGQIITFQTDPNIDATAGTRTLIYTFLARITSATHSAPFQETQTDTANINWGRTSVGNRVNRSASVSITARTPNITILKEQKNVSEVGSYYTTSNISGLPGDIIYYRFTITSNGASPAFNINLSDVLSSKITFIGTIYGPTAGTVTPPGPGGALTWNIFHLNNGYNAVYEFQISINSGTGAGDNIPDIATSTYNSNDVNPITYNENSNQVVIDVPLIDFTKTSPTSVAAIGSTITYFLTVTIKNGVAVNNLSITDVIPAGQKYKPGTFAVNLPPLGSLDATSLNQLIYTDSVATRVGPLILIYTFDTVVVSGVTVPPYTQEQRNIADVRWDITTQGPSATISDFHDVEIRSPNIFPVKEQRNVTAGDTLFTTAPLLGVAASDVIEYRITLTNDGKGDAYTVVTTDVLDAALSYGSLKSVSAGAVTSTPPNVIWTIPGPIAPLGSEILVFQVNVSSGFATGTQVINQSSTFFDTLDTNPTNLGPALSNPVAFNFNNPEILKTVDKNAVFVGDIVSYTVAVTIPLGNIAYNVQLTDTFPPEQTYIDASLKVDGVETIPSSIFPSLVTPVINEIDARLVAKNVIYTFSATVDRISTVSQQAQIDTATVNWTLDRDGFKPGTPERSIATVYVTDSAMTVLKAQSNNIGGPFVQTNISTSVGSLIYYKLSVTNPGPNTIFDVVVTDNFDSLLQIISVTHLVGASNVVLNTLTWAIGSIPISTTYEAIVEMLVLPGGGSGSSIPNFFTAVFDAVAPPPEIEYGPITSNTVFADLPSLEFNKSVSKGIVELGEVITYTLSVIVPNGTKAYNVIVSDTLPTGQNYADNAFVGGDPVVPDQSGQIITFPRQATIDGTAGQVTLNFKFDARVVTGNSQPDYTQIQTDIANMTYEINPQGDPGTPLSDTLDITVNSPTLDVIKRQGNVTQGTCCMLTPIAVNAGDIVLYTLQAISSGASPAYNVVITDVLGPFDDFISIVQTSAGNATYDVPSRTVTWVIDVIAPGSNYFMQFNIEVLPGVGAGGSTIDIASYSYDSNTTTPIPFGPTDTNKVQKNYPNIQITKTPDIINAVVGKVITYTINLTIPNGTLAYNVQLSDIIPVGQQYNNNATLNGLPVIPDSVDGHLITFPIIPFLDATSGAIIYVYTFETLIVSLNVDSRTLISLQVNESTVNWFIDPQTPAEPESAMAEVNVTDSSIQIGKLQRNVSMGNNFTDKPIIGFANQTVEYSLTVTNNGLNSVYDVIITDALSKDLAFVSAVSVPIGNLIHSGGSTNGVVIWSFSSLNSGDSVTAIFSVTIPPLSQGSIENLAAGNFIVNPEDPHRFQTIDSNVVVLLDPPDPCRPATHITWYFTVTIPTKCDNQCNNQCNNHS